MFKRICSLLLAAVMVLSLAACGQGASSAAASSVASSAVEVSHYPVTVTDHAGRTVTIEQEPEKLVSGYYISSSAVIALGLEDKMVGIEAKAGKRPIYKRSAPQLIELPSVGTAKEFDLEGCAALQPDLVILPLKLKSAAETLEQLGIPVLLVNPEDQTLLTEMVQMIAAATNTEAEAEALLGFIAGRQAWLNEQLTDAAKPTVYLAGNSSLLSTAGSGMYQSAMIEQAGGVNAAAELTDSYWTEISYEQLLAWDPDAIVLASDADYTVDDVLTDPNLADCAAVKNGCVYQIPGDAEAWDSPVPGGILGSVWLAGVLHPELPLAAEADAVIDEFYRTFYGFTYSEN